MEIKARRSGSGFIELSVDEISTTIFKNGGQQEAEVLIANLLNVIDDLNYITGKTVLEHVKENSY